MTYKYGDTIEIKYGEQWLPHIFIGMGANDSVIVVDPESCVCYDHEKSFRNGNSFDTVKYATHRAFVHKYIGKLCRFWDRDIDCFEIAECTLASDDSGYPYECKGEAFVHCRPLTIDEIGARIAADKAYLALL